MKHLFELESTGLSIENRLPSEQALEQVLQFDPTLVVSLGVQLYALSKPGKYYEINNSFFHSEQNKKLLARWEGNAKAGLLFERVQERILKFGFEGVKIGKGVFVNDNPVGGSVYGESTSLMELAVLHKDKELIEKLVNAMPMDEQGYEHPRKMSMLAQVLFKIIVLWGTPDKEGYDESFCNWGWHHVGSLLKPAYTKMYWSEDGLKEGVYSLRRVFQEGALSAAKSLQWQHMQWWLELSEYWDGALAVCRLDYSEQRSKGLGEKLNHKTVKVSGPERLKELNPKEYKSPLVSWGSVIDSFRLSNEHAWSKIDPYWQKMAQKYCKEHLAPNEDEEYLNIQCSDSYSGLKSVEYESQMEPIRNRYPSLSAVDLSRQRQIQELSIYLLLDHFQPIIDRSDIEKMLRWHVQRQDHWVLDFVSNCIKERFEKPQSDSVDHLFFYQKIDASSLLAPLDYTNRGGINPKQFVLLETYFGEFNYQKSLKNLMEEVRSRRHDPQKVAPIVQALRDEIEYIKVHARQEVRDKIIERIDVTGNDLVMQDLERQGIRRFTLCGLAVSLGLWDCAEALMEMGTDWRFAKKQIRDQLGFDKRADALAFYEAYELKKTLNQKERRNKKSAVNEQSAKITKSTLRL